jgi:hypothetical protein
MTPEEREEIDQLCRLIKDEQNPPAFMALVQRLLELLARKKSRLDAKEKQKR